MERGKTMNDTQVNELKEEDRLNVYGENFKQEKTCCFCGCELQDGDHFNSCARCE